MILIKAILFDLDGTLLPLDTELFMQAYLKDFGNYIKKAINPQYFIKSLMASTSAMMADQNPQKTNYQIFWEDFQKHMGTLTNIVAPVMDAFYIEKFKDLVRMTSPNPKQATACVQAALQRGLKTVSYTHLDVYKRQMSTPTRLGTILSPMVIVVPMVHPTPA